MKFQVSCTNSLICFILFIVYCFWTGFVYFPAQNAPKIEKSDWRFDAGEICWNQAKFWKFSIFDPKIFKNNKCWKLKNFFSELQISLSEKFQGVGGRAFPSLPRELTCDLRDIDIKWFHLIKGEKIFTMFFTKKKLFNRKILFNFSSSSNLFLSSRTTLFLPIHFSNQKGIHGRCKIYFIP